MHKNHHLSGILWRLMSISISSVMIVSIIAPIPGFTAYAAGIPSPISPENDAYITPTDDRPLAIPAFTWSVIPEATQYRLQVDREGDFVAPNFLNIATANTTYNPVSMNAGMFADGDWYWRIRVEKPTPVGEWSNVMHFTKEWATADNKPGLIEPVDDPSEPPLNPLAFFDSPIFSWEPVPGAAAYRLQIAEDMEFSVVTFEVDTQATSHQPKDRLPNNRYYWRVFPMDAGFHLGTPSDIRTFKLEYGVTGDQIPDLYEPADDSFPTFTPTFRWQPVRGAQLYRLEYTTDEDCDFNVGTGRTLVITRQTTYTPTGTFPNDVGYCWRVRVESSPVVGEWSDTYHFMKKWYLQPVLLTPTHLYETGLYPVYSWTPVPGASRYRIDISSNPNFTQIVESKTTANTTYSPQSKYTGTEHYWWRVTPIDGGDNIGLTSLVDEFQSYYTSTAPILVYPLFYYYTPDDPDYDYGEFTMEPAEDRTVAYPIFIWHRVMNPSPVGGVYANAYRIQVDTEPYFNTIVWSEDTENTSASPTSDNPFVPTVGQDYYWRVCPLDQLPNGSCLVNSETGQEWWSQIWRARFDPRYDAGHPEPWVLEPTTGISPTLLRPSHGQELVEATPLLEWFPYQTVTDTQYMVQISGDAEFENIVISETVDIPAYAPDTSLAQRSMNRLDYGTFYWRVSAYYGGVWTPWSNSCEACKPWRFQVASQSEWRYVRTAGSEDNKLQIGFDPEADAALNYDLNRLYASQANEYWFIGFTANLTDTSTYVIYIDLDHVDNSGGASPPERNYMVSTIPAHQPEFVIYIDKTNGTVDAMNTWVYAWNGIDWAFGQKLGEIGGSIYTAPGYVELQMLNGTIGMEQTTSSASVMVFSVNTTTNPNTVEDTVPSDPEVPGTALLSKFSSVSERMNLIRPPNLGVGDTYTIASYLPFSWDWPTGAYESTPFAGDRLELHLDPGYTSQQAAFSISSNAGHFAENNNTFLDDVTGDTTYYWRVQIRYFLPGNTALMGAWSGGWSFKRLGLVATNLQTSITYATPEFTWARAEGVDVYKLQVSTDPHFTTTVLNVDTANTAYTPPGTLPPGYYYWRVQIKRYGGVVNDWSDVSEFNLTLLQPEGLTPDFPPESPSIDHLQPLCWNSPVDEYGNPVWIAWKYHVQVSQFANFSKTYESVDTVNNCWTPTKGYADGTYYWHVLMIDGNGKWGSYSYTAQFTKKYGITDLYSPINGPFTQTPTFNWRPVQGAAEYRLEVSNTENFTSIYDSIETVNTYFTPTKIYAMNRVYYWRVAMIDLSGNRGEYITGFFILGTVQGYLSFLPIIGR